MSSHAASHSIDRRELGGLAFDPAAGTLSLGGHVADLGVAPTNVAVLRAYVDVVTAVRGGKVSDIAFLREEDLHALGSALDLDDAGLAAELVRLLKVGEVEALSIVERLRSSRLGGGLAKAALAGSLLVGGVALASCGTTGSTGPSAKPLERPAATTTVVRQDPKPPIQVEENGVGLIDPMNVERSGVGLVPAASVDAGSK